MQFKAAKLIGPVSRSTAGDRNEIQRLNGAPGLVRHEKWSSFLPFPAVCSLNNFKVVARRSTNH